jgi:hypothetical protein
MPSEFRSTQFHTQRTDGYSAPDLYPRVGDGDSDPFTDHIQILLSRDYEENG